MNAEKWLDENALDDNWDNLEEGINDALWTNNVIKYMEQYVVYKVAQTITHNKNKKENES